MTTRIGRVWPIGGMPPMVKPVSSFASRAVARRTSFSPVTAASRARSTRFGPGHEAEDRLEPAVVVGRDEHERLDDLAELGADRGGGFLGGVGGLVEDPDLEGHALPGGGVPDALDPGMFGGLGHGGSLPSGGRVASPAMDAILFDWDGTLADTLGCDLRRQRRGDGAPSGCRSTEAATAATSPRTGG